MPAAFAVSSSRISVAALALTALLAAGAQACSGDDASPVAGSDDAGSSSDAASTSDGGGGGGGDAAPGDGGGGDAPANATCNDLTPATAVPVHAAGGDPPAALGGTVADGTYHVVAATFYTGAIDAGGVSLGTSDSRMRITGTTVQVATTSKGAVKTETDTFTFAGDTLTIAPTCPAGAKGGTAKFSALGPDAGADLPKGGFEFHVSQNGATGVLRMALE